METIEDRIETVPRVVVLPTGLEARVQHPADKMAIVICLSRCRIRGFVWKLKFSQVLLHAGPPVTGPH